MSYSLGLVYDERLFNHSVALASIENDVRLRSTYDHLDRYGSKYLHVPACEARDEDVLAVHSQFYLDQIEKHAYGVDPYAYDRDTYIMADSLPTAYLAAGGCMALADSIMTSKVERGFAVIRPPGHHAEAGQGMGFCILNNIAITAKYLQRKYGLTRILILDFDVHHGNGTESIFRDTNEILFVSVHQDKSFPFTGNATDWGEGEGEGYTINLPVPQQFGDKEYTYLMGKVLGAVVEQYMPQIILVSAGFDAHKDETVSKTLITTKWYANITRMLKHYAAEYCDGKLMYILEGGYNPLALEGCLLAAIDSLSVPSDGMPGVVYSERAAKVLDGHILHKKWTI